MSYDADQWLERYKIVKTKVQSKRQAGIAIRVDDLKEINTTIDSLIKSLQTMQASLMEYEISASEIARRQLIIENLRKQVGMIPTLGSNPVAKNIEIVAGPNLPSTSTFNPLSSKGLIQKQKDIMKLQDEMLEEISQGVDVIANQARDINQETKEQLRILDDLEINVDQTTDALEEEARHAEEIQQKTANCKLYICIAIEIVVIIILIIAKFA